MISVGYAELEISLSRLGSGGEASAVHISGVELRFTQPGIWDIDDETLRSRACALAGRELTPAEQQRFLGTRPYQALCPGGR